MSRKLYHIEENGLHYVFAVTEKNEVKLLHFSALPFDEAAITARSGIEGYQMAEVMVAGQDRPTERHGTKYTVTAPGYRMQYREHRDYRNPTGRKLEVVTEDAPTGIRVTSHVQFYDGIAVVRSWSEVENIGQETQTLEYISSFALTGIEKEGLQVSDDKMALSIPYNAWQREMQWEKYTLPQLGMSLSQPLDIRRSSAVIGVTNTGNWSTKQYLPMGYLENTETGSGLFWQVEHNGSWHWEIGDHIGSLYLQVSGPTEIESHWHKHLAPGQGFVSVPVSVGAVCGPMEDGFWELTKYRRAIRRENDDNKLLGIIFNDYMNCLWANPTTEKELPLIDAAHEAGCEYFCVDAGWYHEGFWWDNVGEWLPSHKRFPGGLEEVMGYIRSKGMIPGLWLELEVMGIKCPKVAKTKPEWFFLRHGKTVMDRSRYQLDFRNPEVVEHANEVIDRLVTQYDVGYIKMDYNIEPGIGTEVNADSFGDGLLEHERAYLSWLDGVFAKYPKLIIENCSSGGLRIDYALLSRHSIQSTSDQDDYVRYATIAANSPTGVTPEQSAIWSYPMTEGDEEEVVFNMVNAMLLRIHQSGHLANLSPRRFALVKEGIAYYKQIRQDIRTAAPFWPLGLSRFGDDWVCLGLRNGGKNYIAVWRRQGAGDTCVLPIPRLQGKNASVVCAYPMGGDCKASWNSRAGTLSVQLPKQLSARLFELTVEE